MMKRVAASLLMLGFLAVPPATVVAEATIVAEAMALLPESSPVTACAMQDDWEMTDECLEYIVGAGLACVVAGVLTMGAVCVAAIYFAVAGCTCLSAWGMYDWVTRLALWEACGVWTGWDFDVCGPAPDASIALDDTEECQEDGHDSSPS